MWRHYSFILLSLTSLAISIDGQQSSSFGGYTDLDTLTGVQQSFTVSNRFDRFADQFETDQTTLPLRESAISDKENLKEQDTWRYHRLINTGTLYTSSNTWARSTDDIVHTVSPRIGISRKSEYTYVALFYNLTAAQHVELEEQNTVTHSQQTELGFNFPKLKIGLSNSYNPSSVYAIGTRTELQEDQAGGGKSTVTNDTIGVSLLYTHTPKTTYTLNYVYSLFYFPTLQGQITNPNNSFGSMTHRATHRVSYAWTQKTKLLAQYTFGADDYYRGGKFSSLMHEPRIGISGNVGKTGYTLSGGYSFKDYEDRAISDWNDPTIEFGFFRKILPKVAASLTFSQAPGERLDATGEQELFAVSQFGGLSLNWTVTPKINIEGFGKMGFIVRDGNLRMRDIENSSVSYTRADESTVYNCGLSGTWSPRNFVKVGLAYDYTNFNATFKDNESDTHRIGGVVGLKF